jgi:AraC-like DNA-binding protein/mannose-6-phosphate isomerase-like protein (cupin superfamily)
MVFWQEEGAMPLEELYQSLRVNFVHEIKAAVAELKVYNEDEIFYRRCHELRHDRKALAEYVGGFDIRELRKRSLILPGDIERDEKSGTPIILRETSFFPPDVRNVFLYKHNRYSPVFMHTHNYFEIFFVLQGRCANTIAGRRTVLDAGILCFIAPGARHAIEVFDDASLIINLMIKRSAFDEAFLALLTTEDILSGFFMRNIYFKNSPEYIIFDIAGDAELLEQFFAMLIEQRRDDKQSNRIIESRLSLFFSLLIRKYGSSPVVYEQVGLKERYWKLIACINEHYRTLTLAKLAARFNLSAAYCSRIIKSITGKNFTDLVRDIRMSQARAMLTSSKAKIHEIGFSLGYENQETFIRDFKRRHGMTPNQYRQSSKISAADPGV